MADTAVRSVSDAVENHLREKLSSDKDGHSLISFPEDVPTPVCDFYKRLCNEAQ